MKTLDVLHSNFALSVFILIYCIFKYICVLTHTHALHCRSISTLDLVDNDPAIATYDFENPIYQAEDEGEEDYEILGELSRPLMQEKRLFNHIKSQLKL